MTDDAITVNKIGGRHPTDVIKVAYRHVAVHGDWEGQAKAVDKRLHLGGGFTLINTDDQDPFAHAAKGRLQGRHLILTGATPGRPEIEHDRGTPFFCQGKTLAIECSEGEIRGRMTDRGLGRAPIGLRHDGQPVEPEPWPAQQ